MPGFYDLEEQKSATASEGTMPPKKRGKGAQIDEDEGAVAVQGLAGRAAATAKEVGITQTAALVQEIPDSIPDSSRIVTGHNRTARTTGQSGLRSQQKDM